MSFATPRTFTIALAICVPSACGSEAADDSGSDALNLNEPVASVPDTSSDPMGSSMPEQAPLPPPMPVATQELITELPEPDVVVAAGGAAGEPEDMVTTTVVAECAEASAIATDIVSTQPADIIWAIDSSRSMVEELAFVQQRLNDFSAQIAATGIDVHVVLIADPEQICIDVPLGSGTCPDDSNEAGGYMHVPTSVDSNDGLQVIVESFDQYAAFLRPEASKTFVLVTDDDSDVPAVDFTAGMTAALEAAALGAEFSFSGIYPFTECEAAAAVGAVYQTLVPDTEGIAGDLCLQAAGFDAVFADLAEAVILQSGVEIECEWPFPAPPAGQKFAANATTVERIAGDGTRSSLVRVDSPDACVPNGWYFDDGFSPTTLLACPDLCTTLQADEMGGSIGVTFGCQIFDGCVGSGESALVGGEGAAGDVACDWELPPPPDGEMLTLDAVNVTFTNASGVASSLGNVAAAADCANVLQGWFYDPPEDPTRIFSCPQTCDLLRSTPGSNVDILFGCATLPAVPRPAG